MKKIFLITFSLLIGTFSWAQVDRSQAPKAGPAPKIQLGDYDSFTLENGLKVFLVENHKLPRVSFQLFVDRDEILDGEFAGRQSLMGSMLATGTTSKTKTQIDESIDFIGASLSTSSNGAYASSLSKHKETILGILSDVTLNPTFPQEELDKLKKQTINGLKANASDPGAISKNVSAVLTYGSDFPYGEVETPESVEKVTTSMCKAFYTNFFRPNISYMIIVGDITKEEAQPLMEKYFGGWEKGNVPTAEYPTPTAPEGTHVAFVDKPGAVQSTISIVYPVDLKPGSPDAIPASVMNAILGNGGFMARLIQNIREDKAYTYGAYSSLSTDPLVGDFYAGAEVRNEVTDSAIVQFFYEMNRLATEKVGEEELQNIKNYMNGGFARSLERPQTVARFALNTARYNLPADYYATYLEKLQAVTADDILAAAKKYLRPQNAYLVVVGNKDEVAKKLEVFANDGKVHYYDAYGKPVSDAQPIPAGVTAEIVVQNYMNAIGATSEKLAKLTSQDVTMSATMQGMPIEIRKVTSGSSKLMMTITSGEMVFQKIVINGETGKVSGMMGAKDLSKEEVAEYLKATTLVEESNFSSKSLSLVHIEEMDGHEVYKMEVKDGEETSYHYYDVANGLKWAKIETAETPQGPMVSTTKYADYKEVNGIQYPYSVVEDNGGQVMELQVSKITLGGKVDSNNFKL